MLQSAAAFTPGETALGESDRGNGSADSRTKTLVSCHGVEAGSVFGKEQFPITHASVQSDCSENISAELFYRPSVPLFTSKTTACGAQKVQRRAVRTNRGTANEPCEKRQKNITWFSLEGVEEVHDNTL